MHKDYFYAHGGIWTATSYKDAAECGHDFNAPRWRAARSYMDQCRIEPAPDTYYEEGDGVKDCKNTPVGMSFLIVDDDLFIWFGGTKAECEVVLECMHLYLAERIMVRGTKAAAEVEEA